VTGRAMRYRIEIEGGMQCLWRKADFLRWMVS